MLSQPQGVCEWVWMKAAGPLCVSLGYFGLSLQVEVLCDYLDNLITSKKKIFFFKKILGITLKKNVQVQFIFLTARLRVGLQREAIRHWMHEQLIYLIPRYYHWREILAKCNTLSWEQNQMRHCFFFLFSNPDTQSSLSSGTYYLVKSKRRLGKLITRIRRILKKWKWWGKHF